MSFRTVLGSLTIVVTFAATGLGQFREAAQDPKGPKLGEAKVLKWQGGVIVTAASGPCTGIVGYAPLPVPWPEQELSVVEEDVSPGCKVKNEMVEGTVRVMVVILPGAVRANFSKAAVFCGSLRVLARSPRFAMSAFRSGRPACRQRILLQDRADTLHCLLIRDGRVPLLLTKTDVDRGVDETNYVEWLAERGESA